MNCIKLQYDPKTGLTLTPWGTFDVKSPDGIVKMGLAQLSALRDNKDHPTTDILLEDIAAYEYVIANNLSGEYMRLKRSSRALKRSAVIAKKLGWEGLWRH